MLQEQQFNNTLKTMHEIWPTPRKQPTTTASQASPTKKGKIISKSQIKVGGDVTASTTEKKVVVSHKKNSGSLRN